MKKHKRKEFLKKIPKKKKKKKDIRKKKKYYEFYNLKFISPTHLNFEENLEETIDFFNDIKRRSMINRKKIKLDINLSMTEEVSSEAIMYFLALLNDFKERIAIFHIVGELPKKEEVKNYLEKIGFFTFIKTKIPLEKMSKDKFTIHTGVKCEGRIIAKYLEYIKERFGIDEANLSSTRYLYDLVGECMLNATQHAFPKKEKKVKTKWYIFSEVKEGTVRTVILDTGIGIISTLRKRLKDTLLFSSPEKLLESALNGQNRSQTKMENRGKGLGVIKKYWQDGLLESLDVLTNEVKWSNGKKEKINRNLEGVIFSYDIIRENLDKKEKK